VDKPQNSKRQESHARHHHQDHVTWIRRHNDAT
jgi:hypothetical protein